MSGSRSAAIIAILVVSSVLPPPVAAAPAFEPAPCPFVLPAGQVEGETVECGYLEVPENRSDPEGRTIRVATAIFHPPGGARHPDAVLYLEGGPGGSALKLVGTLRDFDASFAPFLGTGRDLILLDQRGVGYSEPALECPGFSELYLDLLDRRLGDDPRLLSGERMRELKVDALAACAEDLRATADLGAYNSATIAADIDDLRSALGYERLDLWGTSYGTWPALDAMRDHPASVRSVILDAPLPPEADPYVDAPSSYARALDEVFGACAEDAACAQAYPELPVVFWATVEQLDAEPVPVDLLDPIRGQRVDMLIDGPTFLELVFRALYQAPMRAALPGIVYDAHAGVFDTLLNVAQLDVLRQHFRSWGMYFSVLCHDEVPFSSLEAFGSALGVHPELASMYSDFEIGPLPYELCPRWDAGVAKTAETEPVLSDIPALVTTGQYDPIVPPTWGQGASDSLGDATFVLFPGLAHGVSGDPCATEMMLAFIEDPRADVDASCLATASLAPFDLPGPTHQQLSLEPFTSEVVGLQGLRPSGWRELAAGQWGRGASATDPTSLALLALPIEVEEARALLTERLGLEVPLTPVATMLVEGLEWTRYRTDVQGVVIDFAMASATDGSVIAVLTSTAAERDRQVEAILLPVLESLRWLDFG